MRSLRRRLKEADDIMDLQRRLRLLPADLETYFQHMLDSIEGCYQEQSAQIFLIAANAYRPVSVVTYSMLDIRTPDFALKAEIRPFNQDQITALKEKTCKRINARCKDLLEVHRIPKGEFPVLEVDFIHRTARDFLQTKDINDVLRSRVSDYFNPRIFLCEALLVQVKGINSVDDINTLVTEMTRYACAIENRDGFSVIELLDELDRVMIANGTRSGHAWRLNYNGFNSHISWAPVAPQSIEVGFLEFTVQAFLTLYVAHKLNSLPGSMVQRSRASLLLYFSSLRLNGRACVGKGLLDMVYMLLEHGADVNDILYRDGESAWTSHLSAVKELDNVPLYEYLYRLIE